VPVDVGHGVTWPKKKRTLTRSRPWARGREGDAPWAPGRARGGPGEGRGEGGTGEPGGCTGARGRGSTARARVRARGHNLTVRKNLWD